ncbi:MAG: aminopeptidase P family N-terminal domain-containing protein, partial [Propionibacteriaceae bacterium]
MTSPTDVYAARLDRARALCTHVGLDALVVGPGPDLTYLVGVEGHTIERLTALVIPADGPAAIVVPRMELAKVRSTAVGGLGIRIADWVDGEDPYALVTGALPHPLHRVGVSDALPALHVIPLGDR